MKKSTLLFPFRVSVILLLTVLYSKKVFAQPVSQVFTTSGTYTVPAGYSALVTIEAWGAGGGGGTNSSGAKGSGGGGAYASSTITLAAGSYTVTVGNGGTAGVDGGASAFTSLVIADGGKSTFSGSGGAGGSVAASTGTTRIAGANGNNASGNSGGAGGSGGNGGGSGGNGGLPNNGSATSGSAPGGGGGGKAGPGSGGLSGTGGNGRVNVTVNTVLPVRLGAIKAVETSRGVSIEWTTYGASNMDKYLVEHSDGVAAFQPVGEVVAVNDPAERKYQFIHANPVRGLNLYRLRTLDLNGHAEFSAVMRVNLGSTDRKLTLYPNPVTGGSLSFSAAALEKGSYTLSIRNALGQPLLNRSFEHPGGVLTQSIPLPATTGKGICVLEIRRGAERVNGASFMVQ